ncbi:putative DNA-binding protein [Vibrio coralliirubri]|uniref:helix-turn-helix transcriptional regulator n=1 Tax=Vibrio coralliirubri TaxID=1516159 RepID=UPI0006364D01|nr:hypothetical protein [Vibrio coralliirubri]CDT98111.1 putative DNA-binding protein [Vibrio coralliirubri]
MKYYNFYLVTDKNGIKTDDDLFNISDELYEAGCDDATPAVYGDTLYLEFDREAESFEQAIVSAIKNVELLPGVKVTSVDAGEWVGLTDAAVLSGTTKASLSRYNKGERGAGSFPCPQQRISSRNPLWSWSEIAAWLAQQGKVEPELVEIAKVTATINMSLQLRDISTFDKVSTMTAVLS